MDGGLDHRGGHRALRGGRARAAQHVRHGALDALGRGGGVEDDAAHPGPARGGDQPLGQRLPDAGPMVDGRGEGQHLRALQGPRERVRVLHVHGRKVGPVRPGPTRQARDLVPGLPERLGDGASLGARRAGDDRSCHALLHDLLHEGSSA